MPPPELHGYQRLILSSVQSLFLAFAKELLLLAITLMRLNSVLRARADPETVHYLSPVTEFVRRGQ